MAKALVSCVSWVEFSVGRRHVCFFLNDTEYWCDKMHCRSNCGGQMIWICGHEFRFETCLFWWLFVASCVVNHTQIHDCALFSWYLACCGAVGCFVDRRCFALVAFLMVLRSLQSYVAKFAFHYWIYLSWCSNSHCFFVKSCDCRQRV